jgi:hypothetical protein
VPTIEAFIAKVKSSYNVWGTPVELKRSKSQEGTDTKDDLLQVENILFRGDIFHNHHSVSISLGKYFQGLVSKPKKARSQKDIAK